MISAGPTRPPLILHIWWNEVTTLSKEVALAHVFGSDYRKEIMSMSLKAGQAFCQQLVERIGRAQEPDELLRINDDGVPQPSAAAVPAESSFLPPPVARWR